MDLGTPIEEHGAVDIADLREKVLQQPLSFWESDRASRVNLAGDRPGNAVFFYNDKPDFINRGAMREAKSTGFVSVLRYPERPLFADVTKLIEDYVQPKLPDCDVVRVQMAELPPGDFIKPHRDVGILAQIHRMHVPLITHEGVEFIIGGESFFLEEGQLYDLNNVVIHSVENNSDVMRIHLLIDMLPHDVARARYHDTEAAMEAAIDAWRLPAEA